MSKKKKTTNKGDRVQWLSDIPEPKTPGFNKTLRGTVTRVAVDGMCTVSVHGKNYTVSPKKCLKIG